MSNGRYKKKESESPGKKQRLNILEGYFSLPKKKRAQYFGPATEGSIENWPEYKDRLSSIKEKKVGGYKGRIKRAEKY